MNFLKKTRFSSQQYLAKFYEINVNESQTRILKKGAKEVFIITTTYFVNNMKVWNSKRKKSLASSDFNNMAEL